MKSRSLLLLSLSLLPAVSLVSQSYQVGDIVQDYTFKDYKTGASTSLYELGEQGGVLVLEWFAWWCPFCAHAAANVEEGIINYYAGSGNTHGVPVRHIALNVQGNSRPQSDTFINNYSYQAVVEDYQRDFYDLFDNNSGQPLFVVINAEPNSPSAQQWEVLNIWLTYGSYPDVSKGLRPFINSIQPGVPPDPVLETFSATADPVNGWYTSDWFGEFHGEAFPWIFHEELGYGHVLDGPGDSIYLWSHLFGWTYTDPVVYPFLYSSDTSDWMYPMTHEEQLWFYDYGTESWLRFP
jgi:thiol-disulfide isomerase/thioredoxin